MKRVILAALVLLACVGGLLGAWWVSAQRAFDAEVRLQSQRGEVASAARLTQQLQELRRTEAERPYFHYQNLYHDPKGASQGLSVAPSPLASGPGHPLVAAHFQVDARGNVSLPTLNEDLRELNAAVSPEQRAIRDRITAAAREIRAEAEPLVKRVETDAANARASATRIAQLEARLRSAELANARPIVEKSSRVEVFDPSAFAQNVNSNIVYEQLKRPQPTPPPPIIRPAAPPVEIRTSDLEWHTVTIGGMPALVALRAVHTPQGTIVQGVLTQLAHGAVVDGAIVRRAGEGSSIEGTGWRAQLPQTATATSERQRFLRQFGGVAAVLLLVVVGVIWTMSRIERLATDRARFAATAAHELRTPLASLRLYSDLIAEEEDPEKRERYARELAGQTERLGRVVANVLEVTRLERGTFTMQPRPGEIGRAVEACISRLEPQLEAAQCPIELRVADDLPSVAFDPDALHHVVDNLVDNAEKFSRDVPNRSISVDVEPTAGGVAITVSDRGPGIPQDVVREPRPFRRATTELAPSGLGLGMFLVHRIVRGHGGAIESRNREGGGASVRVFLPAFDKA
ncbi:MAG TPA: HAMP domain-containing sensor histidine kinase [Thermoanaerobaculia bacterium]|nr:HAMP domain-containing sensor histidine kinase [Thermoanaerobaculia bacterium]